MQMADVWSEESLTTLDYLVFSKELNTEPSHDCPVLPCVCQAGLLSKFLPGLQIGWVISIAPIERMCLL